MEQNNNEKIELIDKDKIEQVFNTYHLSVGITELTNLLEKKSVDLKTTDIEHDDEYVELQSTCLKLKTIFRKKTSDETQNDYDDEIQ